MKFDHDKSNIYPGKIVYGYENENGNDYASLSKLITAH
jgi:hypothetical protein